MKTNSKDLIPALVDLGNGKYHFNFNVVAISDGYECDTVEVASPGYDDIVNAIIRQRYTASNEFSIHRQKDSKPAEWADYNTYCESVKTLVKTGLNI
jgi:hypothetical protein